VRIHNLDPGDLKLFEETTQGVLRSVDFVYEEKDVVRPLLADDKRELNISGTSYRNQINKVAFAIREIIGAFKQSPEDKGAVLGETKNEKREVNPPDVSSGSNWKRLLAIIVPVLLVGIAVLYFITTTKDEDRPTSYNSIAVLPFENMNNNPEEDYIAIGMSDEIRRNLFKISGLSVRPKGPASNLDINNANEAGKQLKVDAVIKGAVLKVDNDIRISLELVDINNGFIIWANEYTRPFENILRLHSDIALEVTNEISVSVLDEEKSDIDKPLTSNSDAYNFFLLAEFQRNKADEESFKKAIIFYEKALDLDSSFIQAYTSLAHIWSYRGVIWGVVDEKQAEEKMTEYLEKAYSLDSTNIDVLTRLLEKAFYYNWDIAESRRIVGLMKSSKAVGIEDFLMKMGNLDETIARLEWFVDQNPNDRIPYVFLAKAYALKGNEKLSTEVLDKIKHLFNDFWYLREAAFVYIWNEKFSSAFELINQINNTYNDSSSSVLWLNAVMHYKNDEFNKAENQLQLIKQKYQNNESGSPAWFIASYYAFIGDKEKALDWLEKSYQNHEVEMTWLKEDPLLDPIKNDPRYIDLLKKVGFIK